jgi:glucokinase
MAILLAGDIGGTKTILRLAKAVSVDHQPLPEITPLYEETYPSQNFPDLVPLVQRFLMAVELVFHEPIRPDAACFGIAGPVVNNCSELTNLSWSLSTDRLAQELGITQVRLINDFVAIGFGVLGLTGRDVHTLQAAPSDPAAPIAVIGAGTGLGQGFLTPIGGGRYQVFASEGSHADFAPRSELDFQLLRYLKELHRIDRVSVERVVSGLGIVGIYEFLRDRSPDQESAALAEVYKTWKHEMGHDVKTVDLAAAVSQAAIAGGDYLCEQAMRLFVEAYGAEAGNLALKILPFGGLYVAGGISAKILPLLQNGYFMNAFTAKGRLRPLMGKFPVHVVLNAKVGLIGATLCAAQTQG